MHSAGQEFEGQGRAVLADLGQWVGSRLEALIEKRNLASLHYTKIAAEWADQTLAVDPQCYDAHIATGVTKYW
jgi:hypothetical protein